MTICKKHIRIVSFFLMLLLAAACNSVSVISLNVKAPARVVFPKRVDNVVIVNNAGIQPKDEGHAVYSNKTEEKVSISVDSLSTLMCRHLWENIAEQNFFSEVNFYNVPMRENDEYLSVSPLSVLKINDIAEQTGAEAVISLDYFYVKSFLSINRIRDYGIFEAVYEIDTQMQPTIYVPGETRKSIALVDTLFWTAYGISPDDAVARLPYFNDAVFTAIARAGEIAAKALIPHKQTEERKCYSSFSGDMKKAMKAVNENEWDKALDIWISVYEKSNNLSIRARCATNIALAYEIRDDYDRAEEWAVQAQKEFVSSGSESESHYLKFYVKRLKQRKIESALLDMQE